MSGLDLLGTEKPDATKSSWWSDNKSAVAVAGALLTVIGAAIVIGRKPAWDRGWKKGVGWKSENARLKAQAAYARWRDKQNAQVLRDIATTHARHARSSFQLARKSAT